MCDGVMRRGWRPAIASCFALVACGPMRAPSNAERAAPPAMLLGRFVDDYGERYAIDATTWTQRPHGRLHVVRWNAAEQYLIARNESANRYAPGRWTRIDWVSTTAARRATPRTGCNVYPFSRMRRESVAGTAP